MIDMRQTQPHWVMVGVQFNDGVLVLASKDMTKAELEYEADIRPTYTPGNYCATGLETVDHTYRVVGEMKRYVAIYADTYPEAFQKLFAQWSPDGRTAIARKPGEIDD